MAEVTAQIVLRFAEAAAPDRLPSDPLAFVGLRAGRGPEAALERSVDVEAYYDLLERAVGDDDHGLPLRYAGGVRPEDFGALGLALKTASTVREALERIVRYVFVLTDSLGYELREGSPEATFAMVGRAPHRRGACVANEGALAAVTSLLRQISADPITPSSVCFRHAAPRDPAPHRAFFGCPIRFDQPEDALRFDRDTLASRPPLGDEGLSAFLLAQLEGLRPRVDRSLEGRVHRAVTDALCDGPPSRAQIARALGMSERTLHRRLADVGLTFRSVTNRARRDVAESLLALPDHTLAEVAFLTGFSDQSAFQRAFKRWSGQTPLAFRRAAGA